MAEKLIQLLEYHCTNPEYNKRFPTQWRKMMSRNKRNDIRHLLEHWRVAQHGEDGNSAGLESALFGAIRQADVHRVMGVSGASRQQIDDMIGQMRLLFVQGMFSIWSDLCSHDITDRYSSIVGTY